MRRVLPLVLFAASLSFALGVVLPLIRVEKLYFFTEAPSLADIIASLWVKGDVPLAILIGLFSIAFPTLKLGLLHVAAYAGAGGTRRIPAWIGGLSRWSMLDVVLVAIVIFAAKTSGLATAFTQPGLWFFGASVLLTASASALIRH
jgi:paraquat-inducible protein A